MGARANAPPTKQTARAKAEVPITKRSRFEPLIAMTSLRQIEANRRNALKSTGPNTPAGKRRSRGNAVRHGLTSETVIGVLESADDYATFEAAIVAEYKPHSVVTHELVARLASVLWRLRRATAIETALFEMQSDPLAAFRRSLETSNAPELVARLSRAADSTGRVGDSAVDRPHHESAAQPNIRSVHFIKADRLNLAQCYLRLANQPSFALDRLSRYEAGLWRQADQIMLALHCAQRK